MIELVDDRSWGKGFIPALCALLGIGLMLRTGTAVTPGHWMKQSAPPPPVATMCVMPDRDSSLKLRALARDIGRRFHVAQGAAQSIIAAAFHAAQASGVDPTLVLAVAAVESKFKPHALNASTGASGLMQVVPKWHPEKVADIGGESSLMLIAPNIKVGAAILAEYVDKEDGNIADALGHYLGTAGADRYVGNVQREMAHLTRVLNTG